MVERLALWNDVFYEGSGHAVRTIHPQPVISPVSCDFIADMGTPGMKDVVFREDSFDPVTRIRRGRLYVGGKGAHAWDQVVVDGGKAYNWGNWKPEASYAQWKPDANLKNVIDFSIQIGADGFETNWRIVGVEKLTIGHVLLTLRATSLLGIVPELANVITDKDRNAIDIKPVQASLEALVDAIHRQQATPTVDVAREATRTIISTWIGQQANGKDLAKAIELIPNDKVLARWSASIINRLHPRGKSSEQERQQTKGSPIRPVTEEDAECTVNLVGLLLREIGWAVP